MSQILLKQNLKSGKVGGGKQPNHGIVIPTIYRKNTGYGYGTKFDCYMDIDSKDSIYRARKEHKNSE